MEYLKNVILNFLVTKDKDSRRHMIKAMDMVLKFSPQELENISKYFFKSK